MKTKTLEKHDLVTGHPLAIRIGLGAIALGGIIWIIISMLPVPQMGTDEGVFNTVDALFTAVTSRSEKRLAQCEQMLTAAKNEQKLPAQAYDYLAGVIAQAKGGSWEPAAKSLYQFMLAQRREGTLEAPVKKTPPNRTVARKR